MTRRAATPARFTKIRLTRDSDLTGLSALIYGRRSKPDPKNPGKSTTDQVDIMLAELAKRGAEVDADGILVDEGKGASVHSAAKVRSAFNEIMRRVRTEDIAIVALWELSRSTRRLKIHGELMELLEERGCLLMVLDRIYDPSDPDDQLSLGINAVMNAAEAARTRARTLRGVNSAAKMGLPHGRNCYGYLRVYQPQTHALIEVMEDPQQGPIVREIATRVLAGESSRAIVQDLTKRGVPRPFGGDWTQGEIKDICTRTTYTGRRFHHGVDTAEGQWPALIDPKDFIRLTALFAGRTRGDHDTTAKHLLTGVVICGREECNEQGMYLQQSRSAVQRSYGVAYQVGYICPRCKRTRNAATLEAYVVKSANTLLGDENLMADFMGAANAAPNLAPQRAELETLELALLTAEQDLLSAAISPKAFTITERRIEPLIANLKQEIKTVAWRSRSREVLEGITTLEGLTLESQRGILKAFMRVRCLPSRRGKVFDVSSVEFVPV